MVPYSPGVGGPIHMAARVLGPGSVYLTDAAGKDQLIATTVEVSMGTYPYFFFGVTAKLAGQASNFPYGIAVVPDH